jgi:hypothetical protein
MPKGGKPYPKGKPGVKTPGTKKGKGSPMSGALSAATKKATKNFGG